MFPAKRLHEIFASKAREAPERPAIRTLDDEITYAQLDAQANQLARRLKDLGVGPNVLVGLCIDRSIDLIVGLLGILKAGGAYVPIDPAYPRKRIDFLLTDSAVNVVVTVNRVLQNLSECKSTIVCIDDQLSVADTTEAQPPAIEGDETNLAYVIYTSGSTGVPKGVLIEHRNVTRLFEQTDQWFQFNEDDVWTLFHSISFDFSVWEIWGALLYGGCLVIVPYDISRSPAQFVSLIKEKKITVLNQTPSAFRQLIAADIAHEKISDFDLRFVIFGGEALDVKLLQPWIERYGDRRTALVNMYGITETTIHVTYKRIVSEELKRPDVSLIGVPIPDLQIYLLNEAGELVPEGTPGDLYVAGAGLARGYLNRPELTAECFAPKPIAANGTRLYNSGDRAVRMANGEFAYLGRSDDQMKVRGFRIEPREIELCLCGHPQITSAVVIRHDYGDGDARLVAYVIPAFGMNEQILHSLPDELSARAAAELPVHMRPSAYFILPEIPLTPHGKVDRESLRQMIGLESAANGNSQADMSPTEQTILAIWEEILQRKNIGTKDDFFDVGGTSLALMRIFGEVNQHFNIDLDLSVLSEEATITQLASSVDVELQNSRVQVAEVK
jgi:amino acid adenylation domain-containing protein